MVRHAVANLNRTLLFYRWWLRSRGVFWRACLAWVIGCLVLLSDSSSFFDTRFQLRGPQPASSQIVTIKLRPADLSGVFHKRSYSLPPVNELTDITDSFYWNIELWESLLKKILIQNPFSIGVTLTFNENLGPLHLTEEQKKIFYDSRVQWAALAPTSERSPEPLLGTYNKSNIGNIEFMRDEDGVIRRFAKPDSDYPHLAEKVSGHYENKKSSQYINYRGTVETYAEYSLTDVLSGLVPPKVFKDKIVLIGSESPSSLQYLTPLGTSNRSQILAQIIDNLINKRWISKSALPAYLAYLLLITLLSALVIIQYPQAVALTLLLWLGTLCTAVSAWVFDSFYFWLPVNSTLISIASTWIIFLGYKANKIEHKHWLLKQEQQYMQELEQLKNNFVSLISHDLKTPIAKIQAIIDRRMHQLGTQDPLLEDLKALRQNSEELNRYIQSILKMMRVESRDFKLQLEVGDINEAIESATAQLRPLALEKQIDLRLELEPLFSIEVDFTLIREVLINLIENAIKYTPPMGTVTIHSREVDRAIQIEVADTGEGIAYDEIQQVWKKFVRGKDQDMKTKGTGLGLYLVKFFIELHGGKVWIESELKKGTQVYFSLPLENNI